MPVGATSRSSVRATARRGGGPVGRVHVSDPSAFSGGHSRVGHVRRGRHSCLPVVSCSKIGSRRSREASGTAFCSPVWSILVQLLRRPWPRGQDAVLKNLSFGQRGLGVRSVDKFCFAGSDQLGTKLSSMLIRVYENVLPTYFIFPNERKGGSFDRVVSPIIRVLHLVSFSCLL